MLQTDGLIANWSQDLMTYVDLLSYAVRNQAFTSGGLAQGSTTTSSVKVANTVTYTNAGVFHSFTTAEIAFSGTADSIATNTSVQECVWYVVLTNGVGSLVKGTVTLGLGSAVLPERSLVADGSTIIGTVKLSVAANTVFTANTTALNATGITATYVNLGTITPLFATAQ